jgi:hypothetical protein
MTTPAANSLECQFCSALFSRVDAARRHAKRCPRRDGRILLDRKRGRQARSCDQCSRVKVHCNPRNEGPCERCIPRRLSCTFTRHNTGLATLDPSPNEPCETGRRHDGRIPLSFLLNLTDDHQDYLTEEAIGMEPDGIPLGPACLPLSDANVPSDGVLDYLDPSILLLFDHEPYTTPGAVHTPYHEHVESLFGDLASQPSPQSIMSARLDLLGAELNRNAASSLDGSLSFNPQHYRSFFSTSNVHRFITTFCRKRHYRYPVIHWPTFEAEKASLALLLVASLTGAAYSFDKGIGAADAIEARQFYKIADDYVFRTVEDLLVSPLEGHSVPDYIELCQAALLMYGLDTLSTGDMPLQQTAVMIRLPMLVSALRRLSLVSVRHQQCEDWHTFIRGEQMIRIVAWTYCADCLATLTCNKPPSFSIFEMSGDLPCDPRVWEADVESFPELTRKSEQDTSCSLKDLMSRWLNTDRHTPIDSIKFPVFHLHIMLCGTSPVNTNIFLLAKTGGHSS